MTKQKKEGQEAHLADLQNSLIAEYNKSLPEEYYTSMMLLSQSLLKSMAQYERFAKQYDLTYNALMVLMCIRYIDREMSQSAISKILWLPKQTVGSVLNGFKKKGLIVEAPSSSDARAKVITLTEEGKQFSDPIFERLQKIDSEAVQGISSEGLEAVVQSMNDYAKAFEKAFLETSASE